MASKIPDAYNPSLALARNMFGGTCVLMYILGRSAYYTMPYMAIHKFLMKLNNELELCPQSKIFQPLVTSIFMLPILEVM